MDQTPNATEPVEALGEILAEVQEVKCSCRESAVDLRLSRVAHRLHDIIARLKAGWASFLGRVMLATWPVRVALIDRKGHLLFHGSPPGTWPAAHPFEARTWADRDEALDWIAGQSDDFRRRLDDGGWVLVEVCTGAWAMGASLSSPADPAESRELAEAAGMVS